MGIILGGSSILPMGLTVISYAESELTWPVGTSHVYERTERPRCIVLHITGGERSGREVWQTLTNRQLSVEFVVDRKGYVFQFLDPAKVYAAHTGHFNDQSIGIEIVNKGWPVDYNSYGRPLSEHYVHMVDAKGIYKRSVKRKCFGLTFAQKEALGKLVALLCSYFMIPMAWLDQRPYIPRTERPLVRGIVGHCQLSLAKGDPSLDALEMWPGKDDRRA